LHDSRAAAVIREILKERDEIGSRHASVIGNFTPLRENVLCHSKKPLRTIIGIAGTHDSTVRSCGASKQVWEMKRKKARILR
jgi:hypothetical protein